MTATVEQKIKVMMGKVSVFIPERLFNTYAFEIHPHCILYGGLKNSTEPFPLMPAKSIYAGWKREGFPMCCGLNLVHSFSGLRNIAKEEWELWYEQAVPLQSIPAIGTIVHQINQDGTLYLEHEWYKFLKSKGKSIAFTKNPLYPNHAIETLLFMHYQSTLSTLSFGLDKSYYSGVPAA
jgi:hypothetical protein